MVTNLPIIINGELVAHTKKKYRCTHAGCTKAYTKPSRLEEHERSHTGERPFVCDACRKSYLRETHLQAHTRSHLPESERPLACLVADCGKRFWTTQHLKVHEDMHKGTKPYPCTEDSCDEAFAKHHQLRAHICTSHAPPGTKPYRCDHGGCTRSFSTNQKLRTHSKVHDGKRYTCVHPLCLSTNTASSSSTPVYFTTWTSLQSHIRTTHPPTCPYPTCTRTSKVFASHHSLRAHLKLHEEKEVEDGLDADHEEGDEEEDRPQKKRRRGGELGRDWKCEIEGCAKDFKSKKALNTHHHVTHLGRRDHICPHEYCSSAFAYKHLLQRHLVKVHSTATGEDTTDQFDGDEEYEDDTNNPRPPKAVQRMDIDAITGKAYASQASERLTASKALRCPHPHFNPLLHSITETDVPARGSGARALEKHCEYVFSRAYDLRRHLKAEHGVEFEKEAADEWVLSEKTRLKRSRRVTE